jgi:holo-ACP synthase
MEITLEELLASRDRRAAYERELLSRHRGACLIVFTIVWPGPVKQTPQSERLFRTGADALGRFVRRYELVPLAFEVYELPTGNEAYLALKTDPAFLKLELCKLEGSAPYGRLWDMDVIAKTGGHVSREDVGLPERGCIVCGKSGKACASRRLHALAEVLAAADRLAASLPENKEDR